MDEQNRRYEAGDYYFDPVLMIFGYVKLLSGPVLAVAPGDVAELIEDFDRDPCPTLRTYADRLRNAWLHFHLDPDLTVLTEAVPVIEADPASKMLAEQTQRIQGLIDENRRLLEERDRLLADIERMNAEIAALTEARNICGQELEDSNALIEQYNLGKLYRNNGPVAVFVVFLFVALMLTGCLGPVTCESYDRRGPVVVYDCDKFIP